MAFDFFVPLFSVNGLGVDDIPTPKGITNVSTFIIINFFQYVASLNRWCGLLRLDIVILIKLTILNDDQ